MPRRDDRHLFRRVRWLLRTHSLPECSEDVVMSLVIDDHVGTKSIELGLQSDDVVEQSVSGDAGIHHLDLVTTPKSCELCLQLSWPGFVVAAHKRVERRGSADYHDPGHAWRSGE